MTWFNIKESFTTEAIARLGITMTRPRTFNDFTFVAFVFEFSNGYTFDFAQQPFLNNFWFVMHQRRPYILISWKAAYSIKSYYQ